MPPSTSGSPPWGGFDDYGENCWRNELMAADSPGIDPAKLGNMARTCACLNLRMGSRSVTQFFDQALAPTGLRSTQLVILIAAERLGPSSIARLARELVMDRSTLTRNLKPLLTMQLLELTTGNNGKHKSVIVTEPGRNALVRAAPYWERAQGHVVSRIGAEQWNRMVADLGDIVKATRASVDGTV
jgi:DNA-binding MarR family transcriptional regulator